MATWMRALGALAVLATTVTGTAPAQAAPSPQPPPTAAQVRGALAEALGPVHALDVTGYTHILATGAAHSCSVTVVATVWCWGQNGDGQLGDGTTTDSGVPVPLNDSGPLAGRLVYGVDAGRAHTCVVSGPDGDVYCWGANDHGQLGDGTTTARLRPVPGFTDAERVVAGRDHTCVLTNDGAVWCWGRNDAGQLGLGTTGADEPTPRQVPGLYGVVDLAAGDGSTCAVDGDDIAWCWGSGVDGQLGDGRTGVASDVPVAVTEPPAAHGFRAITVGRAHACALAGTGGVYCWGANSSGQLGTVSSGDAATPQGVGLGANRAALDIDAGGDTTCIAEIGGLPYCWGENSSGQLGTGDTGNRSTPAPVTVGELRASPYTRFLFGVDRPFVSEIAAGGTHTCGVDVYGVVDCWGAGGNGQLGGGDDADETAPVRTRLGPEPATGVHTEPGDRSVLVTWTPGAAGATGPRTDEALILTGPDGPDVAQQQECTGTTGCTVRGLTAGVSYAVLVITVSRAGLAFSSPVAFTVPEPGVDDTGGSGGAGLPVTGPDLPAYLVMGGLLVAAGTLGVWLARASRRRARPRDRQLS